MSARASDLASQAPSAMARLGSAWRGRPVDTKDCPCLNILDHFQRFADTAHPFTLPSARSALAPWRASRAQPDDRVWPKSQRSSTEHYRRRRRSRLSSPMLSTSACSIGYSFPLNDRPYASICLLCLGSYSPIAAMPALPAPILLTYMRWLATFLDLLHTPRPPLSFRFHGLLLYHRSSLCYPTI
jgi:hypothetical protein